jgi:hypothetical protein
MTTQTSLGRDARQREWAGGESCRAMKSRTDGSRSLNVTDAERGR